MNLHVTKTGHVLTSQSSFPEEPCFILDTKAVPLLYRKGYFNIMCDHSVFTIQDICVMEIFVG